MPKAAKRQLATTTNTTTKPQSKSKPNTDIANAHILKKLVDNEESVRAEAISAISRLVTTKRQLDLFDLQKLWKGLWFAMWHSDTPIVQQQLARELADLFPKVAPRNAANFNQAFWLIINREWHTLDKYRINKFYLLVRFVLNSLLSQLSSNNWSGADVAQLTEQLVDEDTGPLSYRNIKTPHSLRLHLIDIYVDELNKVFDGAKAVPDAAVVRGALQPVLSQLEYSEFKHIKQRVRDEVLTDERLVEWQVIEPKEEEKVSDVDSDWENDGESETGEPGETSEWEGFD